MSNGEVPDKDNSVGSELLELSEGASGSGHLSLVHGELNRSLDSTPTGDMHLDGGAVARDTEGDKDSGCSGGSTTNSGDDVEIACSPCLQDDEPRRVESVAYCIECKEHLCSNCRKQHRRFRINRNHHLLDNVTDNSEDSIEVPETEHCPEHLGKIIAYFCELHYVPCCISCVDITHRDCGDVKHISEECKDIKQSKDVTDSQERLTHVLSKVQEIIKKKKRHIDRTKFQGETALSRVTALSNIATGLVMKMAEEARDEIRAASEHLTARITHDIDTCETAHDTLKGTESRLNSVLRSNNEPQIFLTLRETTRQIGAYSDFVADKERNIRDEEIHFKTDRTFESMLQNLTSIGTVLVDDATSVSSLTSSANTSTSSIHNPSSPAPSRRRKAIPIGGHSIRIRDDKTCQINGCKFLSDGRIVCADYKNKSIKLFDAKFKYVNHVSLSSGPTDLTVIGRHEVATYLASEQRIQFVIVDQRLCKGRFVDTVVQYFGLAYSNEHVLYASCAMKDGKGEIHVLNMEGNIIRTFDNSMTEKPVLVRPMSIHVDDDRGLMYVTDVGQNAVLCFDLNPALTKNRQPLFVYTTNTLEVKGGLTADTEGYIYVSSGSNSIHQISITGQKVYEILTSADGIASPHCLAFAPRDNLFLVAEYRENSVKLYQMTWGGRPTDP